MAEGEHLSEQTRHLWLKDTKGPLEGTEKHPEGRLFAPTGFHSGDPMRLHPENWMKQSDTPAHDDPISFHSSESSQLPRFDDPGSRQIDQYEHEGEDWGNPEYTDEGEPNEDYTDWSVDKKGRPMADYGSAIGMHFGDIKAATDRDKLGEREHIHPVRIPGETIADPPTGGFSTERPGGSIAGGLYRSGRDIVDSHTGERWPDERWGDSAANFASKATDLVQKGKTLPYRNDVEAAGSTSYRALPETVRTWSEDVLGATSPRTGQAATPGESADTTSGLRNEPHPSLVHLAQQGYNPVIRRSDRGKEAPGIQPELPLGSQSLDDNIQKARFDESASRWASFHQGKKWSLQQAKEQDHY